jgi:hypothetical protein
MLPRLWFHVAVRILQPPEAVAFCNFGGGSYAPSATNLRPQAPTGQDHLPLPAVFHDEPTGGPGGEALPEEGSDLAFPGQRQVPSDGVAARKVRMHPNLENPTVMIVVDRIALDTQITAIAADVPNMVGVATRQELQRYPHRMCERSKGPA